MCHNFSISQHNSPRESSKHKIKTESCELNELFQLKLIFFIFCCCCSPEEVCFWSHLFSVRSFHYVKSCCPLNEDVHDGFFAQSYISWMSLSAWTSCQTLFNPVPLELKKTKQTVGHKPKVWALKRIKPSPEMRGTSQLGEQQNSRDTFWPFD